MNILSCFFSLTVLGNANLDFRFWYTPEFESWNHHLVVGKLEKTKPCPAAPERWSFRPRENRLNQKKKKK